MFKVNVKVKVNGGKRQYANNTFFQHHDQDQDVFSKLRPRLFKQHHIFQRIKFSSKIHFTRDKVCNTCYSMTVDSKHSGVGRGGGAPGADAPPPPKKKNE